MKKRELIIEGRREGYSTDQITDTMTVGELIEYLEGYDETTKVFLSNDGGYTYGSITYTSFEEVEKEREDRI